MSVRVGVVGAGVMGADHIRNLHSVVSGATVTGVADVDATRAAGLAAEVGADGVTDPYGLISRTDVDAVVIASHDSTHADLVLACIEARKPVLCEKPLAATVEECSTVVRAHEAAISGGIPLLTVGFMRRFDPGYVELKRTVSSGAVGDPLIVHCSSRTVTSGPGGDSEASITGSAIHELDTVPWMLDSPVVEVSWHATRASKRIEHRRDPQFMLLRTENGVLTTVELFLNAGYGYDIRCEVVGEDGASRLAEPVRTLTDHALQHSYSYSNDWVPRFADAYRLQLGEWIDSITEGRISTLASARDGLRASVVAQALITSMHSGGGTVAVESPL
ncbi:inositol 2-dehydrogenase [Rhodococcus sp. 06-412-2C]|uniref:Gfo/Idh/MocA family oxidoreductase n=1 Tax=unclassified Rhodococcus (in: high G+C Gram-positive bacteria) TaxID=192944 RepID=UPI000B9BF1B8|nr:MULTISPECIES: Gfo/Idh/MocA family oxidoreductase [unclassified Rhodococcus (in: high G+C Gram-positive bacteria)]OZC87137.1 inositol 2-dehydrogenase [Rhodococcus sp. 06-412-2C]OZD00578.1 inositol 2-dehydrogenase [Rhodococcus sp. 06-412-2B]